MTVVPKIDVRDLESVRAAARQPDLVIGDDWVAPLGESDELNERRRRRGLLSLHRSPIARKIITFNLIALMLLIATVMYMNPSRDNLAHQRAKGLVHEAELIADVLEAKLQQDAYVNFLTGDGINVPETIAGLDLRGGVHVSVYDVNGFEVTSTVGNTSDTLITGLSRPERSTPITNFLSNMWRTLANLISTSPDVSEAQAGSTLQSFAGDCVKKAMSRDTLVCSDISDGRTTFVVGSPVLQGSNLVGGVAITNARGELDRLVAQEREQVLRLFLVGIVLSIGLSLVLASTIANPLADLAAAAELGRDKNARKMSPNKVRIPDLTGRPDEIGRLSGALRGMVKALYERIEGNEQFAADVAHEIKNPLASLRSAVGTMRVAKRDDQRLKLLEVIEHDVRRLDRLVSDIANASRLDSELVKEEEEAFDLLNMVSKLNDFLGKEAEDKGIEYIADLPGEPIVIHGLEGRLAQVFVNLIPNAISFCEDGDAIRVWARQRENRVLIVVEDTGPGIPSEALSKVFQRFYSERPEGQFGNNSGLGLAISKQIVEAHGGVIWAENIRPTEADVTSDPLGARFVVGLPI
jgi:two-component system sensor histidine kinase ChvG